MKKRHLAYAAAGAIAICSAYKLADYCYVRYKVFQAHKENVEALVKEYRGCRTRFDEVKDCMSDEMLREIYFRAKQLRKDGDFLHAGLDFASLGMEKEAREMALRCDKGDRGLIFDTLSIKLEAVRKAMKEYRYELYRLIGPHGEHDDEVEFRAHEYITKCRYRFEQAKTCLSDDLIEKISIKAQEERKRGNFFEAGIDFASLRMEKEAREMAGLCDKEDSERILDVLSINLEAVRKAMKDISKQAQ